MFSFCCKYKLTSNFFLKIPFSTCKKLLKSHYDALGIHPNATQNDIKTAYYKLSKLYHPDKNKGSENAAEKFRAITAAYEVLGNLKLRKMYDRGILYPTESMSETSRDTNSENINSDTFEHAKFYHSRNIPHHKSAQAKSRKPPIYDYDQWTREHYGTAFAKREEAKVKYENFSKFSEKVKQEKQQHFMLHVALCVSVFVFALFVYTFSEKNDFVSKSNHSESKK